MPEIHVILLCFLGNNTTLSWVELEPIVGAKLVAVVIEVVVVKLAVLQ